MRGLDEYGIFISMCLKTSNMKIKYLIVKNKYLKVYLNQKSSDNKVPNWRVGDRNNYVMDFCHQKKCD